VRRVGGRDRLEVPQGTVVFETPGYVSHLRLSPDGKQVGYIEHPLYGDNRGYVSVYEDGKTRRLTREYAGIEGLAWSRDGRELWFAGGDDITRVMAIETDATGADGRAVWHIPQHVVVHDIDARGRVLLTANELSGPLRGAVAGDARDRDLSHGGLALVAHVSRDGRSLLTSGLDASDPNYVVMIRPMDDGVPVRLGSGRAQEISPDGKWALAITPSVPQRVMLLPTGAGEARQIEVGDLTPNLGIFVPGGLTVAVVGTRAGSPAAVIVDVTSGKRTELDLGALRGRAWTARRHLPTHVSPDGSQLAIAADDGKVLAWPLPGGGDPRELTALGTNEVFAGWSTDPSRIYVVSWDGPKARVDALNVSTGSRSFVRDITLEDPAGMLIAMPDLFLSADAGSFAYGYVRMLSTLYLVTGLR
jgi:Tol biopolymer transport system component